MKVSTQVYVYFMRSFYRQMKNRIVISLMVLATVVGMQLINNIWFDQPVIAMYSGVSFDEARDGNFAFPVVWLFIQMLPFYMLGNSFGWSVTKLDTTIIGRLRNISRILLWRVKFAVIATICACYSVCIFFAVSVVQYGTLVNIYDFGKLISMMCLFIFMMVLFSWLEYSISSTVGFLVIAIFYGLTVYIKTPYYFRSLAM